MPVTPEEFVRAWQESASCQEVAKRLGLLIGSVYVRASFYRKRGVRLKAMPRGGIASLDVDALNAVIDNGHEPAPKKRVHSTD